MKTRILIIIGIIIVSIVVGTFSYVYYVQKQCESLPGYWHYPRPLMLDNCIQSLQQSEKPESHLPDDDHFYSRSKAFATQSNHKNHHSLL